MNSTQNSLDSETNENLQGIPNLFVSKQMLENLPNPLTIRQPSVKVHRASNNNDLQTEATRTRKSSNPKKDIKEIIKKPKVNMSMFISEKPNDFFSIRLLSVHVAQVLRSKELKDPVVARHNIIKNNYK